MGPESEMIVLIAFLALEFVAFFLSVIGNIIVIYVIARSKYAKKRSSIFILSVAVADLLVGLIGIPVAVVYGIVKQYDFRVCYYLTSFSVSLFAASILSLVAITIDRYFAICHPIAHRVSYERFSGKFIIICCWTIGILFGIFPAIGWKNSNYEGDCIGAAIYGSGFLIACCIFTSAPTSIMIVLYSLIYCKVSKLGKRSLQTVAGSNSLQMEDNSKRRKEIKVAKTFALIIGTSIICWVPITIFNFAIAITNDRNFFGDEQMLHAYDALAISAAHFNSAINPIIYAYRMRDVRITVKKIFSCHRSIN